MQMSNNCRYYIIHVRTPVSRRLNILCIKFKIIAFFIITLFNRLYARACILLTYGKHFHDRIISLILEVWVHKTRLTPPLFIEVPVPSQESELSCSCVLGVSMLPLSTILILDLRIVPTVLYSLFFV